MRWAIALFVFTGACNAAEGSSRELALPADAAPLCAGGYDPLAGLTLARPFSYVAIRVDHGPATKGETGFDGTLFEHGVPCVDATDRAACEARFATFHASGGMRIGNDRVYVLAMLRDDVIAYENPSDLPKLTGSIDTASEAALLVSLSGWAIECDRTREWKSDDGFRVYARTFFADPCGGPYDIIEVDASGVVRLVGTSWPNRC